MADQGTIHPIPASISSSLSSLLTLPDSETNLMDEAPAGVNQTVPAEGTETTQEDLDEMSDEVNKEGVSARAEESTKVKGKDRAGTATAPPPLFVNAATQLWQHPDLRRTILKSLNHVKKSATSDWTICRLMTVSKATFNDTVALVYYEVDESNEKIGREGLSTCLTAAGASEQRIEHYASKVRQLLLAGSHPSARSVYCSHYFRSFPKLNGIHFELALDMSAHEDTKVSLWIDRTGEIQVSSAKASRSMPNLKFLSDDKMSWSSDCDINVLTIRQAPNLPCSAILDYIDPMCNQISSISMRLAHLNIQDACTISISDLSKLTFFIPTVQTLKIHIESGVQLAHLAHLASRCPDINWLNIRSDEWNLHLLDSVDTLTERLPGLRKLAIPFNTDDNSPNKTGTFSIFDAAPPRYPSLGKLKLHLVPAITSKITAFDLASHALNLVGEYCNLVAVTHQKAPISHGTRRVTVMAEEFNRVKAALLNFRAQTRGKQLVGKKQGWKQLQQTSAVLSWDEISSSSGSSVF